MDNDGLKVNMFSPALEAQYIRLYPVSWYRACTLRFELLGCELHGECWGVAVSVPTW